MNQVLQSLAHLAPLSLAESWDNVGLLLGDPNKVISRILTCLTITDAVVAEAIEKQAELVVSHHPVLFKPVQKLVASSAEGKILLDLAWHGIAVYSAHTAYDNTAEGINDQLASRLQLTDIRPLVPQVISGQVKVITFVLETHRAAVAQAICEAGAGQIGNYVDCTFRAQGIGTFRGNANSSPQIGQREQHTEVEEWKLEAVCSAQQLSAVLAALRAAHPYEEPAMDVVPLHPVGSSQLGSGRIGRLPNPLSPDALAKAVGQALACSVCLTGDRQRQQIETVAIVCGAGGSLLSPAIRAGADAFLTGEIRFHDELAAQAAGITVIAAGHYATERPGIERLAQQLQAMLPGCVVWASSAEQNPALQLPWVPNGTSD